MLIHIPAPECQYYGDILYSTDGSTWVVTITRKNAVVVGDVYELMRLAESKTRVHVHTSLKAEEAYDLKTYTCTLVDYILFIEHKLCHVMTCSTTITVNYCFMVTCTRYM